jgi:hypothetical protein
MAIIPIPIISGDKTKSDVDYFDALPVNMIAVQRDILGASGFLYSHDGVDLLANGQGIDRGAIFNERMGRHFRVSGQKLIEVVGSTAVVLGDIPGSDLVSMDYSFNTLMVIASGRMFLYSGTALTEVTDPDLGRPIAGWWIDGYYMLTDGENIYHTDITNESSIDPLKFATSEISPDPTIGGGRTQDNLAIVFNRYTTEYFVNDANEQFAFSRLNQKAVSVGIVGTHCWCEMDGDIYILGGSKGSQVSLMLLGAGQAIAVSTRTVDKIIARYTESQLSLCKIEPRIEHGDQLIYVHLPDETLCFNNSIAQKFGLTSAWSFLRSGQNEWRCINGVRDPLQNKWVYGDKIDGRIGALNREIASQYGDPVHSEFYTPLVPIESLSVDSVEINTIPGFPATTESIFVSTTRDGNYYSMEWSKEVTANANYNDRYIVRRLGYVRKNIGFKFRSLNKGKLNVSGLVANAS